MKNGKNLKKKMTKLVVCITSSLLLAFCSVCSPLVVLASEEETTSDNFNVIDGLVEVVEGGIDSLVNFVLLGTGTVASWTNNDFLADVCENALYQTGILQNIDGVTYVTQVIDTSALDEIKALLQEYIQSQEPYTVYYPDSVTSDYGIVTTFGAMNPSNIVGLQKYFAQYGNSILWGHYSYNWMRAGVIDSSKYRYAYYDSSHGSVRLVDVDLMPAYAIATINTSIHTDLLPQKVYTYDDVVNAFSNYEMLSDGAFNSDGVAVPIGTGASLRVLSRNVVSASGDTVVEHFIDNYYGQPLQVFNSSADLAEWVLKTPNTFTTTNFYLPSTQPLTIDPTTLNLYNDDLMLQIYNEIVKNGGNALTAEEMQNIISVTITNTLNQINGSVTENTEEIKYTNQILNAILHEMRLFQESNENLLNQIIGNTTPTDDINKLIKDPTSIDFNVNDFSQVTEVMKTKFPFCLPWDMYMILKPFAVSDEEIKAPYFEIPLRINVEELGFKLEYDFIIDLGTNGINDGNEIINLDEPARLIRACNAVLFTVGVIVWVRKFLNKGD